MMNSRSVGDLLHPLRGPLTAEDIALINEEMDRLLVDLFINNEELFGNSYEALEHDLNRDLPFKLHGYLEIVTLIEKNAGEDPAMQIEPGFGEHLRTLLKLVENYHH